MVTYNTMRANLKAGEFRFVPPLVEGIPFGPVGSELGQRFADLQDNCAHL